MIPTTQAHLDLLQSRQFWGADLYAITLIDGAVLRYTSGLNVSYGGHTYSGAGPIVKRGAIRLTRGLDVSELTLTITPRPEDSLLGLPWRQAVRNGALDGARVELHRVHAPAPGEPIVGGVPRYAGEVADSDIDLDIKLTVKNELARLAQPFPVAVFQPGCTRTVYDAGCTLQRSAWQNTATVGVGSTATRLQLALAQARPAGYYMGGEVRFVSGANAGAVRKIREHASAGYSLAYPLDRPVAAGDAVQLWPGCAGDRADCYGKFDNGAHFRGAPHVPSPETAL